MDKALKAWRRRGTQKTGHTYNQPNRPDQHTSQTEHQALSKGQPGRRITPSTTAAVHASAQQQPTIVTHTYVIIHTYLHPTGSSPDPLSHRSPLRSLGALHRRAEPHYTTDTTHLSGDTQRPPPPGGPSSGVADGQPRAHGVLLSKGGGGGIWWLVGRRIDDGGRTFDVSHGCHMHEPGTVGSVGLEYDLVLLGLHCFLRLAHALYCHPR